MEGVQGWLVVDSEPYALAAIEAGGWPSANKFCTLLRNIEIKLSNRGAAARTKGAMARSMQVGLRNGYGLPKLSVAA